MAGVLVRGAGLLREQPRADRKARRRVRVRIRRPQTVQGDRGEAPVAGGGPQQRPAPGVGRAGPDGARQAETSQTAIAGRLRGHRGDRRGDRRRPDFNRPGHRDHATRGRAAPGDRPARVGPDRGSGHTAGLQRVAQQGRGGRPAAHPEPRRLHLLSLHLQRRLGRRAGSASRVLGGSDQHPVPGLRAGRHRQGHPAEDPAFQTGPADRGGRGSLPRACGGRRRDDPAIHLERPKGRHDGGHSSREDRRVRLSRPSARSPGSSTPTTR